MTAIHIKDVPPETLRALKRLARCHRRSLQGELHAVLDQAARLAPPENPPDELNLVTVNIDGAQTFGRGEIYGDHDR